MTDKTDREIMQQALDFLVGGNFAYPTKLATALRERLAQPDPRNQCGETCERAKLCAVCLAEMGEQGSKPEQEPVATVQCVNGITIGYLEVMQPVGTKLYTAPPEQKRRELSYRRGDRFLCRETEEYCAIHIAGTTEQYIMFPDGYCGWYTNEQIAEMFELLPKERGWQGLFFEAVYEAWHSAGMDVLGGDWNTFALALEAKLKEKTHEPNND
jgi:hypothetical protein